MYAVCAMAYMGAYVVYGMMGFGAAALATPFLAHFLPLKFLVPLATVQEWTLGLILGRRAAKGVVFAEYFTIVVPMLAGMAVGILVLINLPQRPAMVILGIAVAANATWGLLGKGGTGSISRLWAVPLGFCGGVISGAFGFGGPLYIIYLARRLPDPAALRSTIGAVIFTSGSVRLALFATTGLLAQENLWLGAAWLFPFVVAGGFIGTHLHLRITPQRARVILNLLMLVTAVSLLLRAL